MTSTDAPSPSAQRSAFLVGLLLVGLCVAGVVEDFFDGESGNVYVSLAFAVAALLIAVGLMCRFALARIGAMVLFVPMSIAGCFQLAVALFVLLRVSPLGVSDYVRAALLAVLVPLCIASTWWLSGATAKRHFSRAWR